MTTATQYICFKCFITHKGQCCPKCTAPKTSPKNKDVWTKRKTYSFRLVEHINYGELDDDGNLEIEDRGDCAIYGLKSHQEAQWHLQDFQPYTRDDGAKVFEIGLEVDICFVWRLNGEEHHEQYVDTIDVDCAPKYIQRLAAKILK